MVKVKTVTCQAGRVQGARRAATTRSLAAVLNSDSVIESSWREPVDMLVSQAGQERIDREVRLLLAAMTIHPSIDHVVPGAIIHSIRCRSPWATDRLI